MPARPVSYLRLGLFAALLVAALAAFLLGGRHYISLQSLAEHREGLRALVMQNFALSLLVYFLSYVLAIVLMFPTAAVLTLAGGFLFGGIIGGLMTIAAATSGATISFLLARTVFAEALIQRAGAWLCRLRAGFQKDALSYLLFLRLVPAFPFWFMNLAPALLGVRLRDFVIATALGIIPGTLAFAFIGAGLDDVLVAQHQAYLDCLRQAPGPDMPCRFNLHPSAFITPHLLIALLLLGLVAILPVLLKKLWKSKASRA